MQREANARYRPYAGNRARLPARLMAAVLGVALSGVGGLSGLEGPGAMAQTQGSGQGAGPSQAPSGMGRGGQGLVQGPPPGPAEPPAVDSRIGAEFVKPAPATGNAGIEKRPRGIDPEFVDKAALSGKRELQASQLAIERSATPAVREFAKRMLDDHGRAAERLRMLGAKAGLPAQAAVIVDPDVEALRRLEGHDFDLAYLKVAGPAAHWQAIRVFEAEARGGHDPGLRTFAQQRLPMLREHLRAARTLSRQLGR